MRLKQFIALWPGRFAYCGMQVTLYTEMGSIGLLVNPALEIVGLPLVPQHGGETVFGRGSDGARPRVARLEELAARYGSRFQPDAGWALLQSRGKA